MQKRRREMLSDIDIFGFVISIAVAAAIVGAGIASLIWWLV